MARSKRTARAGSKRGGGRTRRQRTQSGGTRRVMEALLAQALKTRDAQHLAFVQLTVLLARLKNASDDIQIEYNAVVKGAMSLEGIKAQASATGRTLDELNAFISGLQRALAHVPKPDPPRRA